MALKPTIFKFKISLSDLNRQAFDTLNLTVAQHPSETVERMMVRVLAYSMNTQEFLSFTSGLNDNDQPAIWARTLDDRIALWLDVGEPTVERIKKASHSAQHVKVYSFNSKSDVWWLQNQTKFKALNADIYRFDWSGIQMLATLVERTMDFALTLSGDTAYLSTAKGECEIVWETLSTTA